MRRLSFALVACSLVLSLPACSSEGDSEGDGAVETTGDGDGDADCPAQDAEAPGCGVNPGMGAYKWDGTECIWIDPACGCTGDDCENLYPFQDDCEDAYAGCAAGPDPCCTGDDTYPPCGEDFAPGESCESSGGGRCCDTEQKLWGCDCGEACGIWYDATCN
jgi:hypothetical protein